MTLEEMVEALKPMSTAHEFVKVDSGTTTQIIAALRRLEHLERAGQEMRKYAVKAADIAYEHGYQHVYESLRDAMKAYDDAVGEG